MLDHNTEAGKPGQNGGEQDFRSGYTRQRPVPLSDFLFNSSAKSNGHDNGSVEASPEGFVTERRIELIRVEDKRYREATLASLKKMVEEYSEEVFNIFSPQQTRG